MGNCQGGQGVTGQDSGARPVRRPHRLATPTEFVFVDHVVVHNPVVV
ncbi:putative Polyprenyl synthetase [Streptomyces viridochromogenes Tue57]|uniref:Putative Polyprenyl synthetase n=1 Tax=Streptomyces viridochromogenes Tue57 TaxID=1160705 RepID=L8PSB3_STRVR|nr:putative Polyprenyl synthetase [Streptomyces viridochromogenes Tue57]